jgi:DNA polymerase V
MFALVDCNNFYVSCEQLFDPTLRKRPVVVLSNNDGCVVSRSAEAKAIGIPMGEPWFKIAPHAKRLNLVPRSSNYALYADLSNRVVEILRDFVPSLEVYSIDESFLDLHSAPRHPQGWVGLGKEIRERIAQWLGLPVCVGIGPTKTLAKLANHIAKAKTDLGGVCDLECLDEADRSALFRALVVDEVWGIGRRNAQKLKALGILTVEDLRRADARTLGRRFSVVMERIVLELNGLACIELEEVHPPRQQILSSRSFGAQVKELSDLREAVSSYVALAVRKLREQASVTGSISVMIRTSPFGRNGRLPVPTYAPTYTLPISPPTDDIRVLTSVAIEALKRIYRPGLVYQKAAVCFRELSPVQHVQTSLPGFGDPSRPFPEAKSKTLMATLDAINQRWGSGTVRLIPAGANDPLWHMRQEHVSQAHTTDFSAVLVVKA